MIYVSVGIIPDPSNLSSQMSTFIGMKYFNVVVELLKQSSDIFDTNSNQMQVLE